MPLKSGGVKEKRFQYLYSNQLFHGMTDESIELYIYGYARTMASVKDINCTNNTFNSCYLKWYNQNGSLEHNLNDQQLTLQQKMSLNLNPEYCKFLTQHLCKILTQRGLITAFDNI